MSTSDRLDDTIKALADPHRRAILDALRRTDGVPVGDLEAALAHLGRHAVLKHVRVLEDAELVTTQKQGRRRLVFLNPTPIVELADRWLDEYATAAGRALLGLRTTVESERDPRGIIMNTTAARTTRTIVASAVIDASIDRVWQAITDPDQSSRWFFGGFVKSTWQVGAPIEWSSAEGASLIVGTITGIEPGARLEHTFRATWSPETAADPESHYEWILSAEREGLTRVTLRHTDVPEGTATSTPVEGGNTLVLSSLKTFVETGRTMPGMG